MLVTNVKETDVVVSDIADTNDSIDFQYKNKPFYSFLKRVFDIFVSFICLIILLIPFAVISLIILIDDKSAPPIFVQTRVGKNGKLFKIYKFRTMCANAEKMLDDLQDMNEADGPVFKIKNDPRITRVGAVLRASNIDELPQLFDIFLGHMSFVGPRPERPEIAEKYRERASRTSPTTSSMTGATRRFMARSVM